MVPDKKRLLVILGPTSTGKTDLALSFAKKFNGELISCDSRQVYVGLDIGTGKMPGGGWKVENGIWEKGKGYWEIDGVRIWLYDVVDLKKQYTVADYVKDANQVIDDIEKRGKLPIVVGGTGLYLKALLEGLSNLAVPLDQRLRAELGKLFLGQLQKRLQKLSPKKWKNLNYSDRQNPRRLIRVIELAVIRPQRKKAETRSNNFDVLRIGLTAPREILYKKINKRVMEWVNDGMVEEVINLIKEGITKKRIKNLGLEYAVVVEYLDQKISLGQMIEKMQNKVRQYAKRQLTWFKKEKNIFWFDTTDKDYVNKIEELVGKWYDSGIKVQKRYATKD